MTAMLGILALLEASPGTRVPQLDSAIVHESTR
jgi:hypothetical protein